MQSTNGRDLLQYVEAAVYGGITADAQQLYARLCQAKGTLLGVLSHPGPSAASRAAVQSGRPVTQAGEVLLDAQPDIREILLASDELQLDELLVMECMLAAKDEMGEVCAEAAAGIFYEERRALLAVLHLLLQAQALLPDDGSCSPSVLAAVSSFNAQLLSERSQPGGQVTLLEQLTNVVKSTPSDLGQDTKLPRVIDPHGHAVDRLLVLQQERSRAIECLLYCTMLVSKPSATEVLLLLDTLEATVQQHGSAGGAVGVTLQHQRLMLLMCVLQLLGFKQEVVTEAEAGATEDALIDLAADAKLKSRLGATGVPTHGMLLVARLAWAILTAQCASVPESAADLTRLCVSNGVFRYIRLNILESEGFQDDYPYHKDIVAAVLHDLITRFLSEQRIVVKELVVSNAEPSGAPATPSSSATAGAIVLAGAAASAQVSWPADNLTSLLECLAAVLAVNPELYLDDDQRAPVMHEFTEFVWQQPSDFFASQPATYTAYLSLLTSLASGGEKGAYVVYKLLVSAPQGSLFAWRSTLMVCIQYCNKFRPPAAAGKVEEQRPETFIMAEVDVVALSAFFRLFSQVFGKGSPDHVRLWLRELEEDTGIKPLWELLFQLACHSVPQMLKAAIVDAIAALALRPELAPLLWDRLVAAAFVSPPSGPGVPMLRYDLSYQLNEIQARAEDYSEMVAFVHLLTTLWKSSGAAQADGGRPYAHFTRFIRCDVLGTLSQRAFRDQRQRWQLASACLEHLEVTLRSWIAGGMATLGAGARAPGMDVLLDMLGESSGPAMHSLMWVIGCGADKLTAERKDGRAGAAHEEAVMSALKLLRTAMEADRQTVQTLRQASEMGMYAPLEVVLVHQRKLQLLLEYVCYAYNPALQLMALALTKQLLPRVPGIVNLLIEQCNGNMVESYMRLRNGFASCLQSSIFQPAAAVMEIDLPEEDTDTGGDPRTRHILDIMLDAAVERAPNFTHLLLGFDVLRGPEGVTSSILDPWASYSCLRVLLDLTKSAAGQQQPAALEQALCLLHTLCADPRTQEATLDVLRKFSGIFGQQPDSASTLELLGEEFPEDAQQQALVLFQRAWLLRIAALELHASDAALATHAASMKQLLQQLLLPLHSNGREDGSRPGLLFSALSRCSSLVLQSSRQTAAASRGQALISSYGLDALVAPGRGGEGVWVENDRGDVVIDLTALKDVLVLKYKEHQMQYGGGSGIGSDDISAACRATLEYAQHHNIVIQQARAQLEFVLAVEALLDIVYTSRYELLANAIADTAGAGQQLLPVDVLFQVVGALCAALSQLLRDGKTDGHAAAEPLCKALCAVLSRLQEQCAAATQCSDTDGQLMDKYGSGLRPPQLCHQLLQRLLALLWEARSHPGIRTALYCSLLHYLLLSRPPAAALRVRAPRGAPLRALPAPQALEPVTQPSAALVAAVDEAQQRLQSGNSALLLSASRLVDVLAQDAVMAGTPARSVLALQLLSEAVAAEMSGGIADALYACGLPGRIIRDVGDLPRAALLQTEQSTTAGHLQVVEASLNLLLQLLQGPIGTLRPLPGAQRLFLLDLLPNFARAAGLGVVPEEPGPITLNGSRSVRYKLAKIWTPCLQLVLGLSAGLPHSTQVQQHTAAFVDMHSSSLVRMLNEASSLGTRHWEPGEQELLQAHLVVQLVTAVTDELRTTQCWAALRTAILHSAARFLTLNSKSRSPVVMRVEAWQEGSGPEADDRMQIDGQTNVQLLSARLLTLRCSLAAFLLRLLMAGGPSGSTLQLPLAGRSADGEASCRLTLLRIRDAMQQAVHELKANVEQQQPPLPAVLHFDADQRGSASLFLLENLLAVLFLSLAQRNRQMYQKGDPRSSDTERDLNQLRRVLRSDLDELDDLHEEVMGQMRGPRGEAAGSGMQPMQLLTRRVREELFATAAP